MDPPRGRRAPPSASRNMPRSSWATWSSSSCPARRKEVTKGRRCRGGRIGQGGERDLCAGERRGGRGQRQAPRRAGTVNTDPHGRGLVLQARARRQGRARHADGRGRLRQILRGARTDALSAAHGRDRRAMLAGDRRGSIDSLYRDVPEGVRLTAPVELPAPHGRARGRARDPGLRGEEPRHRVGAALPGRRRLPPSRAGNASII